MEFRSQECTLIEDTGMRKIEIAGRNCYKSEDRIGCEAMTDPSICDRDPDFCTELCEKHTSYKMCRKLFTSGHLTMLEMDDMILEMDLRQSTADDFTVLYHALQPFVSSKYMKLFRLEDHTWLVSGNLRAWIEVYQKLAVGDLQQYPAIHRAIVDIMKVKYPFISTITPFSLISDIEPVGFQVPIREVFADDYRDKYPSLYQQIKRITVRFVTNRGVLAEITRHRPDICFGVESTRFVKYGNITIIFIDGDYGPYRNEVNELFLRIEDLYTRMVTDTDGLEKIQAQIARGIFPNDLKTEIVATANLEEWKHIMNLRYHGITGAPHPHIRQLMGLMRDTVGEKYPSIL